MNRNDISEAIKGIDKDLISESGKVKRKVKWSKAAISVACAVIAVFIIAAGAFAVNKAPRKVVQWGGMHDIRIDDSNKKESTVGEGETQFGSGTLTAGEWKDLSAIEEWESLVQEDKWYEIAQKRNIFSNHIVKVVVKDGDSACYNVPVKLTDGSNVIWESRTNVFGESYLCCNVSVTSDTPTHVEVEGVQYSLDGLNGNTLELDINGAGSELKELDLMLMIDTTASMSDELYYIKEELKDVVSKVAQKNEQLSIRVSVNFYRDKYDEYVVKDYDFIYDINEVISIISEQNAKGGGDIPEAVHLALDNAVNGHQWREDAVKICFLVLDAPPHSERDIKGINESLVTYLSSASKQGIRIIPVMCSGGDDDTEYTMRSFAIMTGGTFVFLTDDSGIGAPHQDVSVGDHEIETLNECMTRIICEYVGLAG